MRVIETTNTSATERGIHSASAVAPGSGLKPALRSRRFEFSRDSFAFANELHWADEFDLATGGMKFSKRDPSPTYAHRCFVLTRAARQFLYHAQFDAELPVAGTDREYRQCIREVMARNPRTPCAP